MSLLKQKQIDSLITDLASKLESGGVNVSDLANGTDGELITWDASGVPTTVAVGTATHVLTSNGVGTEPTFQAIPTPSVDTIYTADGTLTGTRDVDIDTNALTFSSSTQTALITLTGQSVGFGGVTPVTQFHVGVDNGQSIQFENTKTNAAVGDIINLKARFNNNLGAGYSNDFISARTTNVTSGTEAIDMIINTHVKVEDGGRMLIRTSAATQSVGAKLDVYGEGTGSLKTFRLSNSAATTNMIVADNGAAVFGPAVASNSRLRVRALGSGTNIGFLYEDSTGADKFTILDNGDVNLFGALNHDGSTVGLYSTTPVSQAAAITKPTGGATIDTEARTAIDSIIDAIGASSGIGVTA